MPDYHLSIVYGSDHVLHVVAVTNITTLKSERKIAPEIASLSDLKRLCKLPLRQFNYVLTNDCSTVVEHSPPHPKVKGSIEATASATV